jgi:hypothetical protein
MVVLIKLKPKAGGRWADSQPGREIAVRVIAIKHYEMIFFAKKLNLKRKI